MRTSPYRIATVVWLLTLLLWIPIHLVAHGKPPLVERRIMKRVMVANYGVNTALGVFLLFGIKRALTKSGGSPPSARERKRQEQERREAALRQEQFLAAQSRMLEAFEERCITQRCPVCGARTFDGEKVFQRALSSNSHKPNRLYVLEGLCLTCGHTESQSVVLPD